MTYSVSQSSSTILSYEFEEDALSSPKTLVEDLDGDGRPEVILAFISGSGSMWPLEVMIFSASKTTFQCVKSDDDEVKHQFGDVSCNSFQKFVLHHPGWEK